jgi:glycosyltransferase involved in cell wall biosynthesis
MTVFRPLSKQVVREILGLPLHKKLIMFGAINGTSDRNKGFDLLQKALQLYREHTADETEIVVLGATEPELAPDMSFKCNYAGILNDEIALSMYYSAADVFILPSLMDNSPNTVIESMACGVPAIAFAAGGALDMISHKDNGYLAKAYDPADLCEGINWILNKNGAAEYQVLSKNARALALAKYDIDKVGMAYKSLYEEILSKRSVST